MKTASHFFSHVCLIAVITISRTLATHAAPSTNSPAPTQANDSNTVPKSTYNVPASYADGRDPFFPNRTSGLRPVQPATTNTSPTVVLVLNGLSQTYVIINGKTLRVGEEAEIPTPSGRVQVRCIEIRAKENAAVVEVDGERQELKLRSGA